MLPQTYLCLWVSCRGGCLRGGAADLQAILDEGQGDKPIKDLKFRCAKCGSRRTDFVVMSRERRAFSRGVPKVLNRPGRPGICAGNGHGTSEPHTAWLPPRNQRPPPAFTLSLRRPRRRDGPGHAPHSTGLFLCPQTHLHPSVDAGRGDVPLSQTMSNAGVSVQPWRQEAE
jgi:hypothetical protein